jgi:hypothetical protein
VGVRTAAAILAVAGLALLAAACGGAAASHAARPDATGDRQSPVFTSALRSCRHLLPSGTETPHAQQQQELARMLQVSRCMRAPGIEGFAEPTLSPPPDRAGHSAIMSNDGVWLANPSWIDVRSRSFEHAATACELKQ